MRVILAYLAACAVAAIIVVLYLHFEVGPFFSSPPTFIDLGVLFVMTLYAACIIGGILAVPWLSMYFIFNINPTKWNCILFGAVSGLLSILIFQIFNAEHWPTRLNEIDLLQTISPILLFIIGGGIAGATYWAIARA